MCFLRSLTDTKRAKIDELLDYIDERLEELEEEKEELKEYTVGSLHTCHCNADDSISRKTESVAVWNTPSTNAN